jgi:hypothetical protein
MAITTKRNKIMPQLDKVTFLSQFFWLCIIFSALYLSLVKFYLPSLARIVTVRQHMISSASSDGDLSNLFKGIDSKFGGLLNMIQSANNILGQNSSLIVESNKKRQFSCVKNLTTEKTLQSLREAVSDARFFLARQTSPLARGMTIPAQHKEQCGANALVALSNAIAKAHVDKDGKPKKRIPVKKGIVRRVVLKDGKVVFLWPPKPKKKKVTPKTTPAVDPAPATTSTSRRGRKRAEAEEAALNRPAKPAVRSSRVRTNTRTNTPNPTPAVDPAPATTPTSRRGRGRGAEAEEAATVRSSRVRTNTPNPTPAVDPAPATTPTSRRGRRGAEAEEAASQLPVTPAVRPSPVRTNKRTPNPKKDGERGKTEQGTPSPVRTNKRTRTPKKDGEKGKTEQGTPSPVRTNKRTRTPKKDEEKGKNEQGTGSAGKK